MASFQAKKSWERLRKRENKKNRSDQFFPTCNREFQKNSKKLKKKPLWLLFKPKQVGKGREREKKKKKKIVPLSSYKICNRKFKKNEAKKLKNFKKHHYGIFSSQKKLEKAEKERK